MAAATIAECSSRKRRHGAGRDRAYDGRPRRTDREGAIEMAFGCGARVWLRGEISSETLRQVIELLR